MTLNMSFNMSFTEDYCNSFTTVTMLNDPSTISELTDRLTDRLTDYLMVFPDSSIILSEEEYDPITYAHLGESYYIVEPNDDEYLETLTLYNQQQSLPEE